MKELYNKGTTFIKKHIKISLLCLVVIVIAITYIMTSNQPSDINGNYTCGSVIALDINNKDAKLKILEGEVEYQGKIESIDSGGYRLELDGFNTIYVTKGNDGVLLLSVKENGETIYNCEK
ncbi:MAG: hypothetical protein ACK5LC_12110 [Coprobacillaceae bacterium]